mmetsp:Transcript_6769/g.27648  ORF Transcript_6769/g.27648 Transcript_6769/m.27648 type:complete len:205 (+) Transcript_6769:910-1524(+)
MEDERILAVARIAASDVLVAVARTRSAERRVEIARGVRHGHGRARGRVLDSADVDPVRAPTVLDLDLWMELDLHGGALALVARDPEESACDDGKAVHGGTVRPGRDAHVKHHVLARVDSDGGVVAEGVLRVCAKVARVERRRRGDQGCDHDFALVRGALDESVLRELGPSLGEIREAAREVAHAEEVRLQVLARGRVVAAQSSR